MGRFAPLDGRTLDVLVIGGGIIGSGIARDAALRGLSVALFERSDFAAGTTSGSTRLIHGGLRYLEMLDFGLVRLDLREREILLRIAPHLVRPLEFLLPYYDTSLFHRLKMRTGMLMYDALSFDRSLPGHRQLSASEVRAREPRLREQGLQGAASYYDAQAAMPERLCLENLIDARDRGAFIFNDAPVVAGIHEGDRLVGVRVTDIDPDIDPDGDSDGVGGATVDVRGRVVINASGPWFDELAGRLTSAPAARIRRTKGVHVACPPVNQSALALESPIDGRLFFVIPWLGYSWIGTTDTDFDGDPAAVHADADDVAYVMRSASHFFPALADQPIYFSNAGVRALVMEAGSESSVSRAHKVEDESRHGVPGLISILGGKLTGYRGIAEEVTDLACKRLGRAEPCRTADEPLPGARPGTSAALPAGAAQTVVDHLAGLYGLRASGVWALVERDASLGRPLASAYPDIGAQVLFAAEHEMCRHVDDFIWRRTRLGFTPDQGVAAIQPVADLLGRTLGWDAARRAAEVVRAEAAVARTQRFRESAE